MIQKLVISKQQWQEMLNHIIDQLPLEACGLLAGTNERVQKVIPVQNQARSAVRFVMDPYEQLRAFDWIDSQGLDLLGIFHSHPEGPETVSVTDITEAAYEVVHLVWSWNGDTWKLHGFWIENEEAVEVPLLMKE